MADLRKDFYQLLLNERVLLLVACDVDALCTCAILQHLFRGDHVLYTIVPIKIPDDMRQAFVDNAPLLRHVVLVNCGATVDLIDLVDPPDHVIIHVIDTHRPVDVNNIYSDSQVRVISPLDDEDNVPSFPQLYRPDLEDNSDSEDEADEGGSGRRKRYDAASLERRAERQRWQEERRRVLTEYGEFSRHAGCSALLVYRLSVLLSRDCSRQLWLALVALSSQLSTGRWSRQQLAVSAAEQQSHVARYSHRSDAATSLDCLRIAFECDLCLCVYRHWSLYDSLRYTPHVACRLRLFTYGGEKRLLEMLAELGLPLSQCRQQYSSMDVLLREQVLPLLRDVAEKYHIAPLVHNTFVAQCGYRGAVTAIDIAHAVMAVLELPSTNPAASEEEEANDADSQFFSALQCLQSQHSDEKCVSSALTHARLLFRLLYDTVRSMLDMQHVLSVGAFLYAAVSEGEPNARLLARPLTLSMLARYTLLAHVTSQRSRRSRHLPLVLCLPLPSSSPSSTSSEGGDSAALCMVAGVPPVSEQAPRNLLGRAFSSAADRCSIRLTVSTCDGAVVQMAVDQRSKFLDTLAALLA